MNKIFSYHPSPSEEQKKQHAAIEEAFNHCVDVIKANTTDKRYQSIAITDLEKAGAMAVKGVFKNSDGSFIS